MATLTSSTEPSPLQRAFNSFLLTMPPHQLEELTGYLQDVKASESCQPTSPAERNNQTALGYATADDTAPESTASNTKHGSVASNTASKYSTARRRTRDKPLRPLNSFIAFRSFYSTIFPDLTQKAKSGILRFLWQNDPFKAKWAILAKAYSKIRDEHSDSKSVSLQTFLNLNAGFSGIIEPSRYLNAMGWELAVDAEQQYTIARVRPTATKETDISTNHSVNDIVKHCYDTGYVARRDCPSKTSRSSNEPVMSFVAQPSSVVKKKSDVGIPAVNTFVVNKVDDVAAATGYSLDEQAEDIPTPAYSDTASSVENPPEATRAPDGQNPFRFMDNIGVELDWDLLASNSPNCNTPYGAPNPPRYSSPFEGPNIPCIAGGLGTMETFDFDQFVNF